MTGFAATSTLRSVWDLKRVATKQTFSSRLLILALGLIASLSACSSPPVSPAMSISTYQIPSVRSIATSPANGSDPIVGVWDTRVNTFQWQTAFIPGSAVNTAEYEFVGVITTPLAHFTPGEVMIVLNKAAGAGRYAGYQKWRNAFKYFWEPVTIDLSGDRIVQRNQPSPAVPILLDRTSGWLDHLVVSITPFVDVKPCAIAGSATNP